MSAPVTFPSMAKLNTDSAVWIRQAMREGKLPSVQPRQPAMPLKPPAPDHPLSASRTCLPASTGLLLVVMMKSPELIPETAADLSSRASSCTVTRVAM